MVAVRELEIDQRVEIALSALPESDNLAFARATASPEAFERIASLSGRIHRVLDSGETLRIVPITPSLRIVYTREGDKIQVLDLVQQATLDFFASLKRAESMNSTSGISIANTTGTEEFRIGTGIQDPIGT